MGQANILRAFGVMLVIVGVSMLAPMVLAFFTQPDSAASYFLGALISVLVGAGCLAAVTDRRDTTDLRGAISVILLWWIVGPAFAMIPFLFEGAGLDAAYFDAVSALTTTGAWASNEAASASAAGALWRAQLQWLGGLASLSIAAAIFIRPEFIGIDTMLPPFSRGDRASYLRAIRNAVKSFFSVYLLLTLSCLVLLMLAGAPVLDAVIISMSAVASGGFVPNAQSFAAYPFAVIGALLPFLILAGANFTMVTRMLRGAAGRNRDVETGAYLGAIIVVGGVFWLAAGAGDIDLIPAQLFNAASLFSTYGVVIGEGPTFPLAMITVIIGGSAVSTAGGFKILRWLVIIRRAREEVRSLVSPHGVVKKSNIANELGVWIHFLVFTMILAALTLILSMTGANFELAAAAATAILANAGPVILFAEGAELGYAVFESPILFLLSLGMILGRLEAVVALVVFNRWFWRS